MKRLANISNDGYFYLLLGLLFLINISIAGCNILFTLLLLGCCAYLVKGGGRPVVPGFYYLFLAYILFSLISTLFAIDRLNSFKDNKEFFVFLLIPLVILIIDSSKRLRYSLYAVLASALVSAAIGIFVTLRDRRISLDHRLQGLTSHWMTYSGLLMLVFVFFFVYLWYEREKKIKIRLAAALVPILAAILLSLTRSVWVGIFLSLGIFIVYYKPKILFAAVPLLVLVVFLLPPSIKSRITSIVDPENPTNKDRFYMYSIGVAIFKDYPLTGVGPNNIEKIYDDYKPAGARFTNLHLHNNLLHVLAERGLLALAALLAAFIVLCVQLIKKVKNTTGQDKGLALGVLFVFIAFFVTGMFEYNFGDSEIKFMLFYFLALPFLTLKRDVGDDRL